MELLDQLIESTIENAKKCEFWLKIFAYILNISIFCLWYFPERGEVGMFGIYQELLFAYSTPAYHVVLFSMLTMYLLGEPPSRNYQTLLLAIGSVLFGATGVITIYNYYRTTSLQDSVLAMGIISIVISFIMLLDTMVSEGVFKRNKTS